MNRVLFDHISVLTSYTSVYIRLPDSHVMFTLVFPIAIITACQKQLETHTGLKYCPLLLHHLLIKLINS